MNISIIDHKVETVTVEKDITFPYYGWYSFKKEEIVKIYPEYYKWDESVIKQIIVITVTNGFNLKTRIIKEHISSNANIISRELLFFLKDYADVATEKEFNDFRSEAIKELSE